MNDDYRCVWLVQKRLKILCVNCLFFNLVENVQVFESSKIESIQTQSISHILLNLERCYQEKSYHILTHILDYLTSFPVLY